MLGFQVEGCVLYGRAQGPVVSGRCAEMWSAWRGRKLQATPRARIPGQGPGHRRYSKHRRKHRKQLPSAARLDPHTQSVLETFQSEQNWLSRTCDSYGSMRILNQGFGATRPTGAEGEKALLRPSAFACSDPLLCLTVNAYGCKLRLQRNNLPFLLDIC